MTKQGPLRPLTRAETAGLLKRSAEFAARETVDVPAWGVSVTVREVPGRLRQELEAAVSGAGEFEGATFAARVARLLVRAAIDDAGEPLFAETDEADLAEQPAGVLVPLFRAIVRANALGQEDLDQRAGESGAEPAGGASSDSASDSASRTRASS